MRSFTALVLGFALSSSCFAGSSPHYLSIVNDSADTLAVFSAKPQGSDSWATFDVGPDRSHSTLRGGETATLALHGGGGCVYDLRAVFANGFSLTVTDFNTCKQSALHLRQALTKARTT